jgi:hypothetical protein
MPPSDSRDHDRILSEERALAMMAPGPGPCPAFVCGEPYWAVSKGLLGGEDLHRGMEKIPHSAPTGRIEEGPLQQLAREQNRHAGLPAALQVHGVAVVHRKGSAFEDLGFPAEFQEFQECEQHKREDRGLLGQRRWTKRGVGRIRKRHLISDECSLHARGASARVESDQSDAATPPHRRHRGFEQMPHMEGK